MKNLRHHVSDLRGRDKGGWIDPKVGQIMVFLQGDLPRTLRLEDQGRFAVGYYHERAYRPFRAAEIKADATHSDDTHTSESAQ